MTTFTGATPYHSSIDDDVVFGADDSGVSAGVKASVIKSYMRPEVGVYAFLLAQADTTITTATTYYPILGTFTNSPIEGFGAATVHVPGIKYTGTETRYFKIDWFASLSADANSTTVKLGIKMNGVLVGGSVMQQLCKTAGELYNIAGTCVVELETDDEIQLVITSDDDGDVITFVNYTTAINHFFG
jgi:hypothetical protein